MVLGVKWLQLDIDISWRFSAFSAFHSGSGGRGDKPESSSPESVFGAVVSAARSFDDLFFRGILKVSKLEIVDGMLNHGMSVSIHGNSYFSVSDSSYSY